LSAVTRGVATTFAWPRLSAAVMSAPIWAVPKMPVVRPMTVVGSDAPRPGAAVGHEHFGLHPLRVDAGRAERVDERAVDRVVLHRHAQDDRAGVRDLRRNGEAQRDGDEGRGEDGRAAVAARLRGDDRNLRAALDLR